MDRVCRLALLVGCLAHLALAQSVATLHGTLLDPAGQPVPAATVVLTNAITGYRADTVSAGDGRFTIGNVPWQEYSLVVRREGFAESRQTISLRTSVPLVLTIAMTVAAVRERVQVSGHDQTELVDVEATGTRMQIAMSSTERMPVAIGTRGLEAVLLSFPGFAQNANGAIHPRGAHNQMTFVLDGMPISDQLTGSFASALDPNTARSIELFTGNVPAEFGNKVSGVASIITRSGAGSGRRFGGSLEVQGARFDTLGTNAQVYGESGRVAWFGSLFALKSNRFLDPVSLDNLHNGGNSQRGYGRVDVQLSSRDALRLHVMGGRSSFQLANLRSQHVVGQRQRQELEDAALWATWVRTLDARSVLEVTGAWRQSLVSLRGSAGDTPVTAEQARQLETTTVAVRHSLVAGRHALRLGVDTQRVPLREAFSFGITDAAFNDPAGGQFRPGLLRHDLTRGGAPFHFSARETGTLVGLFAQDQWRLGALTLSLGLRHDTYRFLVNGSQWQPRVGLAYAIRQTGTVFRASYNRNYQTPPNENLLLSSSVQAAALAPESVRDALGGAVVLIQPERQNVFEAGVQQAVGRRLSVNVSAYHKNSRDQQDNDNFLNTGVIFPVTLSRIRVNGAEARLVVLPRRGWSGTLSLTHARAISTPPFTGGLFLNEGAVTLLTGGPFVIDHDQPLSAHGTLLFESRRGFWASSAVRYDAGLVANAADPEVVRRDPDYADLLPYVDLDGDPARVRSRTIVDAAIGYTHSREGRRAWEVQLQATNLFNQTALYNFQSVFVGTRVVPPRTLGAKVRVHF